ncbi:MAG TPA: hypothetical protein ENI92_08830 [Bacteroidetes bacterium]|nr:hypothetical protein [Bacteroidota bacterium]
METRRSSLFLLVIALLAGIVYLAGCAEENKIISEPPGGEQTTLAGCVGCHTDAALLQATAEPEEEPPPSSGEG